MTELHNVNNLERKQEVIQQSQWNLQQCKHHKVYEQ